MTLRKGTRVEFSMKDGTVHYGVVAKGGSKKATVVLDGGEQQVTGSIRSFRLSDKPLPKDVDSPMERWGLKSYKGIEGHGDSPTFHAKVTLNGKVVGTAENNGWGGPNLYRFTKRELEAEFYADLKKWATQYGHPDMFEPDGTWVEWYVYQRPYGVTGESVVQEAKRYSDEFNKRHQANA